MGLNTKIQWTDASINFWTGCRKVSEGCKYCYMYRDKERYGLDPTDVVKVKESTVNKILRGLAEPSKIFTCSWSDFFIEEADAWRDWAWQVIRNHPQHQWQILTKRPERIKECLPADWGEGYDNVWLGVSIESDKVAYNRLWRLIEVPAKVKFVSAEPLLSFVDLMLEKCLTGNALEHGIDWVIVGGESGNDNGKYRYRDCEIGWIHDIVRQCRIAAVPVFVKQLGTALAKRLRLDERNGGNMDEWPKSIQVRQFPNEIEYIGDAEQP